MVALHTLVKTRATDPYSFTELIEKSLKQSCKSIPPMEKEDWFRVSSIGGICPREEVLCSLNGVVRRDSVSADLGMTFEMGHAIHWVFQNRVMPATGRIVGQWRCTWCGEEYGGGNEGLIPRPQSCLRCGAIGDERTRVNSPDGPGRYDAFVYVEPWVGNAEYKIGGHPDGFYADGDPATFAKDDVVLLEFKSASTRNYYKYKKAPDFMHVVQAQTYLWLTGYRRAKIIYIDKGTFGMGALAIHDLDYDPGTIARVQEAIVEIRAGIAGGPLPERSMCASEGCRKAKGCEVSEVCFTK